MKHAPALAVAARSVALCASFALGARDASASTPDSVVPINPFEVTPGREADCLAIWHRAAAFLSASR